MLSSAGYKENSFIALTALLTPNFKKKIGLLFKLCVLILTWWALNG
jgi:hypothetical protein